MKESKFKKYWFYIYMVYLYCKVAILWRIKGEHISHHYFIDSKTIDKFYKEYGLKNILGAIIRIPQNLNLSTTGFQLFKNAYFPKVKKTVLSTSIEITNNCSYKCYGCYINIDKKKSSFVMSEINLRQTIESLSHSTFILIQGGEPLQEHTSDMLYQVLKDFKEQIFVIVTTGVHLSKNGLGNFQKLNNILWSISINGTRKTNDEIRFKGSFKHAIKAMENIRKAQQYFVTTVTLSRKNIENATSKKFILFLAKKGVKEIRYLILRESIENQLTLHEINIYEHKVKKYNKYIFCNFCVDELIDYSVIDPYGNVRIDRTGKDHTLEHKNKHYF